MCNDQNGDGTTDDEVTCSTTKLAGFDSEQCADQTSCNAGSNDTACCEAGFALPRFQCDWLVLV